MKKKGIKICNLIKKKNWNQWYYCIFPIVLLMVLVGGIGAITWLEQVENLQLRQQLLVQVKGISQMIAPEQIEALSFTFLDKTNPQFIRLRQQMMAYSQSFGYRSIYSIALKKDQILFGPESLPENDPLASPPGTVYQQPPAQILSALHSSQIGTVGPYRDEYGQFITAYAPINDPISGKVLMLVAMDIEVDQWHKQINRLKLLPIGFTLIVLAILLIGGLILHNRERLPLLYQKNLGQIEVYLSAICGLAFTIAMTWLLTYSEFYASQSLFTQIAEAKASKIAYEFKKLENETLSALAYFFESSEFVGRSEFHSYTNSLITQNPVKAWGWIPRVEATEKEKIKSLAAQEGLINFSIFQKNTQGKKVPSENRQEYYPVFYIEPFKNNESISGYDLGSSQKARTGLLEAIKTGLPTVTDILTLDGTTEQEKEIIIYYPIFKTKTIQKNKNNLRVISSSLKGFVIAVLDLNRLIQKVIIQSEYEEPSVYLNLLGLQVNQPYHWLVQSNQKSNQHPPLISSLLKTKKETMSLVYPMFLADKAYAIFVEPGPGFVKTDLRYTGLIATIVGILLTGVLTNVVATLTRRRTQLEQQVQLRTVELEKMAERLRLALEAAKQGMFDFDLQKNNSTVSPQYALMLDYNPQNFQETFSFFLERTHRQDRGKIIAIYKAYLKGEIKEHNLEFRQKTAKGTWKWILSVGKIVQWDAQKQPLRLLGTHTDITDRKQTEAKIKHLADYDPLTGLPNRRLFLERLENALSVARSTGQYGAILFIDLDQFKTLNDARGHDAGDRLLQEVAARLTQSVRKTDTVARFGGDEFVVLLPQLFHEQAIAAHLSQEVAQKVRQKLSTPFVFKKEELIIGASIGITLFPKAQETINDLLKEADTAMYHVKDKGRNGVSLFDHAMLVQVESRFTLEKDLRRALERQELRLYLQPQVDSSERIVGAEVLLRWQHPVLGLVPPCAFIPLAEETGLIVPIGEWVLKETCLLLDRLVLNGHTFQLSVNVSPRQLCQTTFFPYIEQLLAHTKIPPNQLTLEVTERVFIKDIEYIGRVMSQLQALGVHLSLDDFGTGYSSLAYLKGLPFNEIKIDKSFVQDALLAPSNAALIEAILAVAHHFNLTVVAEGVETIEQAEFLKKRGCHFFQGYLYGKPEPLEHFIFYSKRHSCKRQ